MAFQYLVKVLRAAFSHSLSRAQDIIFVLLILGGIITYFAPALHMSIDVSGWQIAAVVLGGIVTLRLLLAPYWIYKADQETIRDLKKKSSSSHTTLTVELHQKDQTNGNRSHRIGVTNKGSVVAKNVKVWLQDISPRPSIPFRNDFPYRVAKADAVWSIYSTIPTEDVDINPNEEEPFQIFESWLIGDQSGELAMQGLDTRKNGNSYAVRAKPGSEWVLAYEISSANAPSIKCSITVAVGDKNIVALKNS